MRSIIKLLKKRGSSGFTLVEMVVSVALLAILLGGMMLFITPIVRSFNDTQTDLTAENVAVCLNNYITRTIRYSSQVAVFSNTNYTDIQSSTEYKARIQSMNAYCTSKNGGGNNTYYLRCLSLKYDDATKRYYLYEEDVDQTNGNLNPDKAKKVFSDCFYNDLYMTFEIVQPENGDYPTLEGSTPLRNDALQVTIAAYKDEDRRNMVYHGDGVFELRQIKGMLAHGAKATEYNVTSAPATLLDFGSMTDGSRDIYIYYVRRTLAVIP